MEYKDWKGRVYVPQNEAYGLSNAYERSIIGCILHLVDRKLHFKGRIRPEKKEGKASNLTSFLISDSGTT